MRIEVKCNVKSGFAHLSERNRRVGDLLPVWWHFARRCFDTALA